MARSLVVWFLSAAALSAQVDYGRQVRPILANHCFTCHGPDGNQRKANLRLDVDGGDLESKSGRRAIVAGDAKASELVRRIRGEGKRMPPASSHKPLTPEQVATLVQWVEAGGERTPHWSFVAPTRPPVPASPWPTHNAIDAFVHQRLQTEGLIPAVPTDPLALIRRVSLDLTGLPPTPEQAEAFAADLRPDAYERLVDQLLASPQHAEHMARPWLDAVRYGDTHGLHLDNVRTMWPYRDWVIQAFSRNQPFDQFTVEQLAGDLLPSPTPAQRIASGYNRCNPTTAEGGLIDAEYLAIYAKDRVATTGTVWLGLTLGCATCHDHKYDPISQRDFYRLYGFFNSLAETASYLNAKSAPPDLALPTPEQAAQRIRIEQRIAELEHKLGGPDAELDAAQARWQANLGERLGRAWHRLEPRSALSRGGATMNLGSDGVVTVSGSNPSRDEYVVTLATDRAHLRAVRVRALPAAGGGVGRGLPSNIVLTDVSAGFALSSEPLQVTPLSWQSASADFAQDGFPATAAIDADPLSGWALGHGGQAHELVLATSSEFGAPAPGLLTLTLRFQSVYAQHQLARFLIEASTEPEVAPSQLGSWSASEPVVAADFAAAHACKLDQQQLTWHRHPEWLDNQIHNLPAKSNSATFLRRRIHSPSARPMRMGLGSDDALRVFCNGELVFENFVRRQVAADQDQITVMLQAGDNDLVLQISSDAGTHGFFFRMLGEDTAGLPTYLVELLHQDSAPAKTQLRNYYREHHAPGGRSWRAELVRAQAELATLDKDVLRTMVSQELAKPRPAQILLRGAYDQPGETVSRGVPKIFAQLTAPEPTRLDLARWLIDRANPLTARVFVNRLWAQLFGTGIVKTLEDFGVQGEWPSHGELLDWLACEFMDRGFDIRHMQKLMVMSATYRQTAAATPVQWQQDRENRWLARGPRVRLDAEVIRDQALAVSGLLVDRMGGPGVKPYQPGDLWKEIAYVGSNTMNFVQDHGEDLWRRSIYTFWKRTMPPANLQLFDAPSREACVVRRARTNTPLQALVLLNDSQFVEAARCLASRELQVSGDDGQRLRRIWYRVLIRPPNAQEEQLGRDALAGARADFSAEPSLAKQLLAVGEAKVPEELTPTELAAWTVVAQMVLNLDEAVTKR